MRPRFHALGLTVSLAVSCSLDRLSTGDLSETCERRHPSLPACSRPHPMLPNLDKPRLAQQIGRGSRSHCVGECELLRKRCSDCGSRSELLGNCSVAFTGNLW